MFDMLRRLSAPRRKQAPYLVPLMRDAQQGSLRWHCLNIAGGLALVLARQESSVIPERFGCSKRLYKLLVKMNARANAQQLDRALVLQSYNEVRVQLDGQTRLSFIAFIEKSGAWHPDPQAEIGTSFGNTAETRQADNLRFQQFTNIFETDADFLAKREFHDTDSAWFNETLPFDDADTYTQVTTSVRERRQ